MAEQEHFDRAVEALAAAMEDPTRCCSLSDGDGSLGRGWAHRRYLRVAEELLQAAAPHIEAKARAEERERLEAAREKLEALQTSTCFSDGMEEDRFGRWLDRDEVLASLPSPSDQATEQGEETER